MSKADRIAIYHCIYDLRYDMDCIGETEYNFENTAIWLDDLTDKEVIDILIDLLGEMI